MTGLLKDLAARFAPQATAPIQPRPAFRFEGEGEAEGFQEIAAETRAPAPRPRADAPRRGVTAPSNRAEIMPASEATPMVTRAQAPSAPASHETRAAVEERPGTLGHEQDARPGPEPDSTASTAVDVLSAPQTKVERAVTHETFLERIETVRIAQSAPGPAERTVSPQNGSPAAPESPSPGDAPAEPAPEQVAEPARPAPSIRIGRIEVRAPAKPAPPPAPPRPAPAPSTQTARPAPAPAAPARSGLTDYLGWRR